MEKHKYIVYVISNLINSFVNLINTVVTATIIISLYKITKSMNLEELVSSFSLLLENDMIRKLIYVLVICSIVKSITSLISKKIEVSLNNKVVDINVRTK